MLSTKPLIWVWVGTKVDWDFRISDLLKKKPWWNWCLTPVANFGEVRRAQLARSTHLTSSLVPLGFFKVCSDAKERVGCGKQREATAPNKFQVKLEPWFLSLRWKTCLRQNCSLGFSDCSEGPAFGQSTDYDYGFESISRLKTMMTVFYRSHGLSRPPYNGLCYSCSPSPSVQGTHIGF